MCFIRWCLLKILSLKSQIESLIYLLQLMITMRGKDNFTKSAFWHAILYEGYICETKVLWVDEVTKTANGKKLKTILIVDNTRMTRVTLWESDDNRLEAYTKVIVEMQSSRNIFFRKKILNCLKCSGKVNTIIYYSEDTLINWELLLEELTPVKMSYLMRIIKIWEDCFHHSDIAAV